MNYDCEFFNNKFPNQEVKNKAKHIIVSKWDCISDNFTTFREKPLETIIEDKGLFEWSSFDLESNFLEGSLVLSNFPNLELVAINNVNITDYQINNCPQLTNFACSNNTKLTKLVVNCPSITNLQLANLTNLQELELGELPYLENLYFGNIADEKNKQVWRKLMALEKKIKKTDEEWKTKLADLQYNKEATIQNLTKKIEILKNQLDLVITKLDEWTKVISKKR